MPQHVANHPGLPDVTGLPEGYAVTINGVLYWVEDGAWRNNSSGEGFDGRQVQLQASETHVQWRYEGDPVWIDLFPFASLPPGPGVPPGGTVGQVLTKTAPEDFASGWVDPTGGIGGGDAREVQLQVSATHIQWRYEGQAAWTDLIALSELGGGGGGGGSGIAFLGIWDPAKGTSPAIQGPLIDLSQGLEAAGFTVTATGPQAVAVVDAPAGGGYAIQFSGGNVDYEQVHIEHVVDIPASGGTITFSDAIYSEQHFDRGFLEIDGVRQYDVSGTEPWTARSVAISGGTHTLRWGYDKDSSFSAEFDLYYLGDISLPVPGPPSTGYGPGDIVHHAGSSWLAVQESIGVEPVGGSSYWVHLGVLTIPPGPTAAQLVPSGGTPTQVLTRVGTEGSHWADVDHPDPYSPSLHYEGAWDQTVTYVRGKLVLHESAIWESLLDANAGLTPGVPLAGRIGGSETRTYGLGDRMAAQEILVPTPGTYPRVRVHLAGGAQGRVGFARALPTTSTVDWLAYADVANNTGLGQWIEAVLNVPFVIAPGDTVWMVWSTNTTNSGWLGFGDGQTGLGSMRYGAAPTNPLPGYNLNIQAARDITPWGKALDLPEVLTLEDIPEELPAIGGTHQNPLLHGGRSSDQTASSTVAIPAGTTTLLMFVGYWGGGITASLTVDGQQATKIGGEWTGQGSGSSARVMSVWRYDYPLGQSAPASVTLVPAHSPPSANTDFLGMQIVALDQVAEIALSHVEGVATSTSLDATPTAANQLLVSAVAARGGGMTVDANSQTLAPLLNRSGNTLLQAAQTRHLTTNPTVVWTFTGQDYSGGDNYVHVVARITGEVGQSPNEGKVLGVVGAEAVWTKVVAAVEERALTVGEGAITLSTRTAVLLMATFAGAARLRIYRTATGRADDLGRAVTTPYPGGRGLVYEYVATKAETTEHSSLNLARLAAEPGLYYHLSGAAVTLSIKEIV